MSSRRRVADGASRSPVRGTRLEDQGRFRYLGQPADVGPLIALLEREGQDRVFADYWIAYRLTFLSNERIILAATGVSRIYDYNRVVAAHRANPIHLSRQPCPEGPKIADGVYLCR